MPDFALAKVAPMEGTAGMRPRGLVALLDLVHTWIERSDQRRALAALEPRLLKDVGVSPAKAMTECNKPFWRD